MKSSTDQTLAAIAEKSLKEVTYHLRWSSEWVIRLGDGTEESHQKMAKALDELWSYTGEIFEPAPYEKIRYGSGFWSGSSIPSKMPGWRKCQSSWKKPHSRCRLPAGCRQEEKKENIESTWDLCWRK